MLSNFYVHLFGRIGKTWHVIDTVLPRDVGDKEKHLNSEDNAKIIQYLNPFAERQTMGQRPNPQL